MFDPKKLQQAIADSLDRAFAEMFGEPFVYADRDGVVKGYYWKDAIYVTEHIVVEEPA